MPKEHTPTSPASRNSSLKREMTTLFNATANVYADVEFFKMFAEKLAAFAGLREGQRVLDVATGRGGWPLLPQRQ